MSLIIDIVKSVKKKVVKPIINQTIDNRFKKNRLFIILIVMLKIIIEFTLIIQMLQITDLSYQYQTHRKLYSPIFRLKKILPY